VLFVFATDSTLYFVDVLLHDPPPWSNSHLVVVIHENWRELIAEYKSDIPVRDPTTDEDRQEARAAGVQTLVTMPDGTSYWPFGGGYSSARQSARVRSAVDHLRSFVRDTARKCSTNSAALLDIVRKETGKQITSPDLCLVVAEDPRGLVLRIRETQTGFEFPSMLIDEKGRTYEV